MKLSQAQQRALLEMAADPKLESRCYEAAGGSGTLIGNWHRTMRALTRLGVVRPSQDTYVLTPKGFEVGAALRAPPWWLSSVCEHADIAKADGHGSWCRRCGLQLLDKANV